MELLVDNYDAWHEGYLLRSTGVVHQTDKAVALEARVGDPVWLPKSLVCVVQRIFGVEVYVTPWLAKEKRDELKRMHFKL